VLDTGGVRCWGFGLSGRLGYGNTDSIGDDEDPATAGDLDLTDPVDLVTLGVVGLPVGAAFTPGAPANPALVTFTWTPTSADVAYHAVTFTALDGFGLAATPYAVKI
jgi:hypothetical protein